MKKLECIIRPSYLDALIVALEKVEIGGLNITQIVGYGSQKGSSGADTQTYRGVEYSVKLKEKLKVEMIVDDKTADKVIETVIDVVRTDTVGDGKIFVYPVQDAIRIRTGEKGDKAL